VNRSIDIADWQQQQRSSSNISSMLVRSVTRADGLEGLQYGLQSSCVKGKVAALTL
jgi:hypothetical protein